MILLQLLDVDVEAFTTEETRFKALNFKEYNFFDK